MSTQSMLAIASSPPVAAKNSLSVGENLLKNDARRQATWLALAMSSVLTPAERELLRVAAQLMRQLADADVSRVLNPAEAGG